MQLRIISTDDHAELIVIDGDESEMIHGDGGMDVDCLAAWANKHIHSRNGWMYGFRVIQDGPVKVLI
jgi:hypothetical protein